MDSNIYLSQDSAEIIYCLTSSFFLFENLWINLQQMKLKGHLPFFKPGLMRTCDWAHIPEGVTLK